ncbi:hypothetical protein [Piscirickettsia litoralis]|uniref:Uncharacterized protein n=1 Tax=Piscirickettsia litoralis TaxID=1891921 RepID=A0ABX3A039_9GAMM|nr:hypothetical protein [Piscirickettsia litoralis]ODN41632.1 hypothetical protein BGC07_16190 [Piscirickettsia litoralis]
MTTPWKIENDCLVASFDYDAALTSAASKERVQEENRLFFKVTINGDSPSKTIPVYDGGSTEAVQTDFIVTYHKIPVASKKTHDVEIHGIFHRDVYKQLKGLDAKTNTVVFSFSEPNKQQSCKAFDAVTESNPWFTAFKPSDPIVIRVSKDMLEIPDIVDESQLYTEIFITGNHMIGYKNDYALQQIDQLNIARSVNYG